MSVCPYCGGTVHEGWLTAWCEDCDTAMPSKPYRDLGDAVARLRSDIINAFRIRR